MSESGRNLSGRYKEYNPLPLSNPEIPDKKDWWDDLCKAHGAKNVWKKNQKKPKKGK
jgi:hypothetical protein